MTSFVFFWSSAEEEKKTTSRFPCGERKQRSEMRLSRRMKREKAIIIFFNIFTFMRDLPLYFMERGIFIKVPKCSEPKVPFFYSYCQFSQLWHVIFSLFLLRFFFTSRQRNDRNHFCGGCENCWVLAFFLSKKMKSTLWNFSESFSIKEREKRKVFCSLFSVKIEDEEVTKM